MNTATRFVSVPDLSGRRKWGVFAINWRTGWLIALVLGLLFSAFGVVYVKDLNRRLFIQYQTLQHEKSQHLVRFGKLLLEQSTWSTQARVQQIAEHRLGMKAPAKKHIILVKGTDRHGVLR